MSLATVPMRTRVRISCNGWTMTLLFIIYLKTKRMKTNWKSIVLYVIRVIELVLTGAAGGAASQLF